MSCIPLVAGGYLCKSRQKNEKSFLESSRFFGAVVFFVGFSQFIFERSETQAMDIPKILEKKDTFHSMMNKIFPWMKK